MAQQVSPVRMQELSEASQAWFAMLAGMQLDLFTPLDNGPLTAGELASALGVDPEKLSLLLYALVVAGFLTVEHGRFANTEEADQFLVRGKPTYMGNAHLLWAEFGEAGLKTAESIRTGIAQTRHDYAAMSEDALFVTLGGLHAGALGIGRALATRYDFRSCRTVLDVAGGSGGLSIALTEMHPDVRATIVELPNVIPVTQRFIRDADLTDRIEVVAVDVLHETIPGPFDAAVLSKFLQVLSVDESRAALRNVKESLHPGGMIYVINSVLDNSRLAPAAEALLNVLFLNFYDHGQSYTDGEIRGWIADAGFVDISREEPIQTFGVHVARKPV
jgi:precorrin-6B methylase 2